MVAGRKRTVARLLCFLSLPCALAAHAGATTVPFTHCTAGETVAFSCDVGRKTVSVCIDRKEPASISYRYGRIGSPEMTITSSAHDGKVFAGEIHGQGDGFGQQIRFRNGDWSYIVFAMTAGRLSDVPGRQFATLVIVKGSANDRTAAGKSPGYREIECNQDRSTGDMGDPAIADLAQEELEEFLAWW